MMNNLRGILLAIIGIMLFVAVYQYDSERSKRIELELMLLDAYTTIDEMSIFVGAPPRMVEMWHKGFTLPDSLLAIPPNRPLLKKMLEGNYIDSVGIGESRTWMRPKGTDSIIEVTDESGDS